MGKCARKFELQAHILNLDTVLYKLTEEKQRYVLNGKPQCADFGETCLRQCNTILSCRS